MLLKTRLRLLVVAVALVAFVGAASRVRSERRDLEGFVSVERDTRTETLGQIFALTIRARETWVFDNSYWDELVTFVRGEAPPTWAAEIYPDALELLDADGLFLYDADRRLVYAVVSEGEDPEALAPATSDLFGPTRVLTFFRWTGDSALEVSSATIHPTTDAAHETPPQGALAVVKRWDADALGQLAVLTGASLSVASPDEPLPPDLGPEVTVQTAMNGISGEPVARLRASYPMPVLHQLVRRRIVFATVETVAALSTVLVVAGLLSWWVLRPLARMTTALDARDPSSLDGLRRQTDELGVIARLIADHFAQSARMASEIADRVAAEAEVTRSLRDKEVLLREIHHRVKNNLQVISSLLSLQADQFESAAARASIQESVFRVRSMALIHQQLYGTESLSRIDLAEHARSLAQALRAGLAPDARVDVSVTGEVTTDAEVAVPIGLILNELLTNAFKYGTPTPSAAPRPPGDGPDWDIQVALAREGDTLVLVVRDRGPGLPETFGLQSGRTLGLQIVRALLRQVKGTLTPRTEGGAVFELRVPVAGPLRVEAPSLGVGPVRQVSPGR